MLLKQSTLRGIADGSITLQFRRWKRPSVTQGGSLLTAIGELGIEAVDQVEQRDITSAEARAAGWPDRAALLFELDRGRSGRLYRIRLSLKGPDPRVELRERRASADEIGDIRARLDRFDARSRVGPWTREVLGAIRDRPAVRAAELARALGVDTARLKVDVRKLKALGLTESLEIGYRLSPRGEQLVRALE